MPQTSYSLDHSAAIAGQVVESRGKRGRYECSEDLNFGRLVELSSGQLRQPQATTLGTIIGGIGYNASLPPGGYKSGEFQVPVQRRAQMWIEYTGTAPTAESKPNICHASSDVSSNAQHRGKVTGSATSAVAGAEVSAAPEGIWVVKVDTALSLALVELNLPA